MADANLPRRWTLGALAAVAAVALVPIAAVGAGAVTWRIPAAGALTWGLAVLAKIPLGKVLAHALGAPRSDAWRASVLGAMSAAVELGVAAGYLTFWPLTTWIDILGFGAGAGSAEAAYIIVLALVGPPPEPDVIAAWERGARESLCVRYMLAIERFFALIGHTGSRGLVAVAAASSQPAAWLLLAVALVPFAATDGVAAYGKLRQWNWSAPAVCRRAHAFFAGMSMTEALLLAIALQVPG